MEMSEMSRELDQNIMSGIRYGKRLRKTFMSELQRTKEIVNWDLEAAYEMPIEDIRKLPRGESTIKFMYGSFRRCRKEGIKQVDAYISRLEWALG